MVRSIHSRGLAASLFLLLASMSGCTSSSSEEPLLVLQGNPYPWPIPYDEYVRWEGSASPSAPPPIDCSAPDDDLDGDGLLNDEDGGPLGLGPQIADLPFLHVSGPPPYISLVYTKDTSLRTIGTKDGERFLSDSAPDQPEIRATFGWRGLGERLRETFGSADAAPVFRLDAPPSLSFSNGFVRRPEVLTQTLLERYGQAQLDSSSVWINAEIQAIHMTHRRAAATTPLEVILVSHDPFGAKKVWSDPIQVGLRSPMDTVTAVNLHFVDSLRLFRALERGEIFSFEPFRAPSFEDPSTGEDFSPYFEASSSKTMMLVEKGRAYEASRSAGQPYFSKIAVRSAEGGGCITLRRMLELRFGAEIEFGGAGGSEIERIFHLQTRLDDRSGDDFRRWIVGVHTGRKVAAFGLDMELEPGDTVVLYYLRGEDFDRGTGEEITDFDADDEVGVIPADASACPPENRIQIHMDDEDDDNRNASSGWIGATRSGRNTTFHFCRVDGSVFGPLRRSSPKSSSYAVLKLGDDCPAGSTEFVRYFDNEDDGNENGWRSEKGIEPNRSNHRGTRLHFCLFVGEEDVPAMAAFPEVGFPYGVFAGPSFDPGSVVEGMRGWLETDDEDDDNRNRFLMGNQRYEPFAREIVEEQGSRSSYGGNTKLHIARVR